MSEIKKVIIDYKSGLPKEVYQGLVMYIEDNGEDAMVEFLGVNEDDQVAMLKALKVGINLALVELEK